MRVDLFDFDLPEDRIAQRPVSPREAAKLLAVAPETLTDAVIGDLPEYLRPGDILVVNDTRVIPARLHGRRGGVSIEILLHRQQTPDTWQALSRPAKRLKPGHTVEFEDDLRAEVLERTEGWVTLRFNRAGAALMQAVSAIGHMPLPPYLGRVDDAQDRIDYQTVYAAREGAVAAPTAGLHLTPALLEALDRKGVRRVAVTLHVGAGTFLPVSAEDTDDHVMHAEWGEVGDSAVAAIAAARAAGGRVVAVGTTSLRILESAAADGMLKPFAGDTRLFITPGYRFKAVDLLLTNFHLPRSTLYMLVCAFAGTERMRAAYAHAIAQKYRFYSYGDACLLTRSET
ncbi:MAG: tRNA preQ1(34) S-adenosylmethionine ribosyltransferase-isomerase QueA [Rhodospirillaceae bacterium]|nr:tRNA preQ1(34) S-adenosylmethionine ribosyltransferase-isomerase QueA [Rhodospirillaceae bacterium]